MRVFAVADGNVASNVVGLQGVGVAQGLADKGYIYTDRPAYRAGQIGPRPRLPAPRGRRRLHDREGQEVHARSLRQPQPAGPAGEGQAGRVRHASTPISSLPADQPAGRSTASWSATTASRTTRARSWSTSTSSSRCGWWSIRRGSVYYRGEEIEGTIRAAFYYGAPLAGREIRYQLADDRQHTATTDAKGEVQFKLPTREFSETQVLPLVVDAARAEPADGGQLRAGRAGFSIDVSTVRPVYVAGETFEVDGQDATTPKASRSPRS